MCDRHTDSMYLFCVLWSKSHYPLNLKHKSLIIAMFCSKCRQNYFFFSNQIFNTSDQIKFVCPYIESPATNYMGCYGNNVGVSNYMQWRRGFLMQKQLFQRLSLNCCSLFCPPYCTSVTLGLTFLLYVTVQVTLKIRYKQPEGRLE